MNKLIVDFIRKALNGGLEWGPSTQGLLPDIARNDEELGTALNRQSAGKVGHWNKNLKNRVFNDLNANSTSFSNCDFSYSIFHRGYFHNTKFTNCSFVGCRFYDCNFREARFSSNDFRYCSFQNSIIPSAEIISNLPPQPNLKRDILQVLKVNAEQVGDYEGARKYVDQEIKATKDHLIRAIVGEDHYYKEKYSSTFDKLRVTFQLGAHMLNGFFWGHGERPGRLVWSLLILGCICTLINALAYPAMQDASGIDFLLLSLMDVFELFLDISQNVDNGGFLVINYFVVILRYIYIGLFITVLAKYISVR